MFRAQVWKRFGLLVNIDAIQDVRDEDAEEAHARHAGPGGASSSPGGLRTCRALVIGPEYQPLRQVAEETVERLKVRALLRGYGSG